MLSGHPTGGTSMVHEIKRQQRDSSTDHVLDGAGRSNSPIQSEGDGKLSYALEACL